MIEGAGGVAIAMRLAERKGVALRVPDEIAGPGRARSSRIYDI
ncbi:hypothetical protein [Novosphingobium sp. 11B]